MACFYTAGCELPLWFDIASKIFYFPYSVLSGAAGKDIETNFLIVSIAWGLIAMIVSGALLAALRRQSKQG